MIKIIVKEINQKDTYELECDAFDFYSRHCANPMLLYFKDDLWHKVPEVEMISMCLQTEAHE